MGEKNIKVCEKENSNFMSRRKFLGTAGGAAIGAGLFCATGGLLLTGCNTSASASKDTNTGNEVAAPDWPYKYTKLDPEKVAQRTFEAYKDGG